LAARLRGLSPALTVAIFMIIGVWATAGTAPRLPAIRAAEAKPGQPQRIALSIVFLPWGAGLFSRRMRVHADLCRSRRRCRQWSDI